MSQKLMLKIILDPSLDEEEYDEVSVEDVVLYATVKSVAERHISKDFVLDHCPLIVDAFTGFPETASLIVHNDKRGALLYCKWSEEDKDGLNYLELPVRVEVVREFPSIEFEPEDKYYGSTTVPPFTLFVFADSDHLIEKAKHSEHRWDEIQSIACDYADDLYVVIEDGQGREIDPDLCS